MELSDSSVITYFLHVPYGLFTARCFDKSPPFTRQEAAYLLPKTNPFLRDTFDRIAGIHLDERIVWAVDDLAELLNRTDISAILQDFGKRTRQEDPVVHFYETFLSEYDRKLRETRGVYYTPEPVVSYIVRSVDKILQDKFNLPKGLADSSKLETGLHRVLILDPATGTGTFLYNVIKNIARRFENNRGMWDGYVSQHLLPRIFGFELLVAPYAVAHLKLGLLLEETGYKFETNERLRIYLNNTLDFTALREESDAFSAFINNEAQAGREIQQDKPVMVILGNPPYSGHSANTGKWINDLLRGSDSLNEKATENYFMVDGQPLGEKNPKWLNDDYVKFIRFSQWRIEQTGYGVLAFVTNHGYLDNPTFRGMRQSLLKTFDEIYIVDLHGNSKKKEKSPDGSKDENVFDIQQGVAIGIFVKREGEKGGNPHVSKGAVVKHKHLYGVREIWTDNVNDEKELTGGKYYWLWRNEIDSTEWTEINPNSPFYLFTPQDETLREEYNAFWKITDVMPVNVLGFQTHRDFFAVDFEKSELQKRISDLRETVKSDDEIRRTYNLTDGGGWTVSNARKELRAKNDWQSDLIQCSYRPFDNRFCYFSTVAMDRPRRELIDNVAKKENLCFNIVRQTKAESWQHSIVSNLPTPAVFVEIKDGSNVFPLYLYPTERRSLFDAETTERQPNFSAEFIAELEGKLKVTFRGNTVHPPATAGGSDVSPEDVFNYTYAVFHSPNYRTRYAEFLKIDFPRLPITSNLALFRELANLGSKLVELHLLEKDLKTAVTFPEKGSNEVEFVKFQISDSKFQIGEVWINKEQYFANVPENVWNFHIGGYQVLQKWLKDRKGRTLEFDDLEHYAKVVSALLQTIELMQKIDGVIEENGGFPIG